MRRRKTPPDTDTFHFADVNPSGVVAGDCAVRSIALATGRTWEDVYDDLCLIGRQQHHMPDDEETIIHWFELNGWKRHPQPRHGDGTKLTGSEFTRWFAGERCVLNIGEHHQSVLIDGRITDTWDCTSRRVGVYWTPGDEAAGGAVAV